MSTNFENSIKSWVSLDNQIKILNDKSRELREERNDLGDNIMNYVETNSLNSATVNISDGKLRFISSKQTAPLNLKFIEQCLGKCIAKPEQVEQIMKFIKEERSVKYVPDIKRYYAKEN